MTDFNRILLAVAPQGKAEVREGFAAALPSCIGRADLTTPMRLAHFLAQCAHESAGFATTTELASGVDYEGRRDLGNVRKGDGKRFKGRGLLQITGRANYEKFGAAIGVELMDNPAMAAAFPTAALTAAEFWRDRGLNRFADSDDVRGVTRGVNGGLNGLASRMIYLARAKRALADLKGALLDAAATETAMKHAKLATAATATPLALAAPPQMQLPPWGAALLMAIGVAAVLAILVAANRHKQAAADLTAAAHGV